MTRKALRMAKRLTIGLTTVADTVSLASGAI
jgi:hypothetical protein